MSTSCGLDLKHIGRGRVLHVQRDGTFFASRGFKVCRSRDDGVSWTFVTKIPCFVRRCVEASRLACRLSRHEIKALVVLSDGRCVASNRAGVFTSGPGEHVMRPSAFDKGCVSVMPPMTITRGADDRILWGEYGSNHQRREIHLFISDDGGRSFSVGHVFAPGEIRHVHNIVPDVTGEGYWVLSGDHGCEPGIGWLSADLQDFRWVVKGAQSYRAVCAFDCGDRLIYATDTEKEANAVMSLEKATGRVERGQPMDGSCIYACRFGDTYVLTTTIEPSVVNANREAGLWLSRDGDRWSRYYSAAKDRWPGRYFQFGSIVLPRGESDRSVLMFSGQALKGIDGRVLVGRVTPHGEEAGQQDCQGSSR